MRCGLILTAPGGPHWVPASAEGGPLEPPREAATRLASPPERTARLAPLRDATLIEHPAGLLGNGSGERFFAGRTSGSMNSIRRGVIAFDLGSIPPGARVTGAALSLVMDQTNAGPVTVALHRLLAGWGEGGSASSGGGGAPAVPGDATWRHRFFDTVTWARPGGDFEGEPSAETVVDQPDLYEWTGGGLVADLQAWVENPSSAHGWILIGDETVPTTVKRFASREEPDPALRPLLVVTWTLDACARQPLGPGHWRRQCLGLFPEIGGLSVPGKGHGPPPPRDERFQAEILPCATALVGGLGLEVTACRALDIQETRGAERQVLAWIASVAFNVCSDRLALDCPIAMAADRCEGDTIGGRLRAAAARLVAGDVEGARACVSPPARAVR